MQAFYGNRTYTELREDTIDYMLQGVLDKKFGLDYEADRTTIVIPDSKCVLVYNKYQEADQLKQNEEWKQRDGYAAMLSMRGEFTEADINLMKELEE